MFTTFPVYLDLYPFLPCDAGLILGAGFTQGPLLTQVHVSGSGVALLVAFAAPQLHELHVQLVEDVPVQCVHCVYQLVGKEAVKGECPESRGTWGYSLHPTSTSARATVWGS